MRSFARALAIVVALLAPSAHADVPIVSDAAAVEAYRKGDLATARSEWLALLQGPDAPRNHRAAQDRTVLSVPRRRMQRDHGARIYISFRMPAYSC